MIGQTKERKWTSSGSAQPRNRLNSALKKPVESEQGRWARPPSTMPDSKRLRPGSRMEARPDSRLDSRPVSRQGILNRPKSGVRPLSGKVFMRRTTDHGWVAKAYNVNEPTGVLSQTELDLFEDLSDCESLDSFFDDDFDVQTSEEKLGNLLSCNTLGVETKGNRPDWVAGTLGIPEFHCPRCRDHWYGLTDVPCDEELARLIREGLWKTGRGDSSKGGKVRRRPREIKKEERDREYKSYSNVSLTSKTSSTHLLKGLDTAEGKRQRGSNPMNEQKEVKKVKKRITFKLDNEFESSGSNNGSGTQLDNYGGYKRGWGAKSFGDGLSSGDGRQIEASDNLASRGADVKTTGMGGAGEGCEAGGIGGGGSGKTAKRQEGKLTNLEDDSDGSGLLDSSGLRKKRGDKDLSGGVGRSGSGVNEQGNADASGSFKSGAIRAGLGDTSHQMSCNEGTGYDGLTNIHKDTAGTALGKPIDNLNKRSTGLNAGQTSTTGASGNGTEQKSGSRDPLSLSSSSQARHTGSRRGSISTEDHGKNVRKPGGYMRAVSPSASEWGDPAHARPFISSTATSRTVSRVGSAINLAHDDQEDSERLSLPPIVPAIQSKKPLLNFSDLMGGFQFTRAWTFSYHK